MFTGIVAERGALLTAAPAGTGVAWWVATTFPDLALGESIACDGVCLTVEEHRPRSFRVHVGEETLRRTTLGERAAGHGLHLERALRLGDRLGGHWVSGHVDGVGVVRALAPGPEWTRVEIALPPSLSRYVVAKGSIAVDGVSLTVNEAGPDSFAVGIIPHTAGLTRMASLRVGDRVNLETDILAKHVERLLAPSTGGLSLERLASAGFPGTGGSTPPKEQ